MNDINEVRERLAVIESEAATYGDGDDLRALLDDHARLQAVSQQLEAALTGLTGFVVTGVVESCNGNKCREPWCAGCFGDEAAEQAASEARNALATARAALTAVKALQLRPGSGEVQSDST